MTYELAKQLKDAAFQSETFVCGEKGEPWYAPTLSELIESCGEKFGELSYFGESFTEPWFAGGGESIYDDWEFEKGGYTPEEAVARLWLALQPPKAVLT
jgi:hypothetical protein